MTSRFSALLALLAVLVVPMPGAERNGWPLFVAQGPAGSAAESWQALGPLFFGRNESTGAEAKGLRPLFLQTRKADREARYFLYPLFTWQQRGDATRFSFFNLLNERRAPEIDGSPGHHLDFWPLYFSRDTGKPETSYAAFFPLGGEIKSRFGKDHIQFVVFPLYARVAAHGGRTTYAPWPFLRFIDGGGHHGFEFWPLFGQRGRTGDYRDQFFLWPLLYQSEANLTAPQPDVKLGALPFYSRDTGPGYRSETFVWPFFGYTHRTAPKRYDETRYLWPFFVQGRGDHRYVNRWGPVFTHSIVQGRDKIWLFWPLIRHEHWNSQGVAQGQTQLLYFLFWSHEQRRLANPQAAPAYKTHLWPFFSAWDNGAGRRQVQLLSPFEVFFPQDDVVRQLYTPLFAVYRYDRRGPAEMRWSLLWSAVSWDEQPGRKEFHLGPLFSAETGAERGRIALGNGLLGFQREPERSGWRFFLFDFRPKSANKAPAAPSP